MRRHSSFPVFLILSVAACGPRGEVDRDPSSPVPIAGPPVRADEAPLVRVAEALGADSLLGRRVRVAGYCTAAGAGRRKGSWTLEDAGISIEVRGLVPASCAAQSTTELTIFAQIEAAASGSQERLLLRLPD
jgi:hypothetical protein